MTPDIATIVTQRIQNQWGAMMLQLVQQQVEGEAKDKRIAELEQALAEAQPLAAAL